MNQEYVEGKSFQGVDFSKKEQTQGSREKQKTQIIRQIKNYSVAIKKTTHKKQGNTRLTPTPKVY